MITGDIRFLLTFIVSKIRRFPAISSYNFTPKGASKAEANNK